MYISETQKIRPLIQKYLSGLILDIGCGHDPVTETAFGIDSRDFPHVKHRSNQLDKLSERLPHVVADVVYSSHCLEHFKDDKAALMDWIKMIRDGGFLILYLPDDRYYDNAANPEHLHRYVYEDFVSEISKIAELQVVKSGLDVGYDRYSFFVVCKKRKP